MTNGITFEPWQRMEVAADLSASSSDDLGSASNIGLPGKIAFLSYIEQSEVSQFTERGLITGEIGMFGGYSGDIDRTNFNDMERAASIWSVNSLDEVHAVARDLIEGGYDADNLAGLKSLIGHYALDDNVVIIASREISSRRTSAILAISRSVRLLDDSFQYEIVPIIAIGDATSQAWAAAKAGFGMQATADYECLAKGMAAADFYRPVHTYLQDPRKGDEALVSDLPGIIDMAQDNMLDFDNASHDMVDFERLKIERTEHSDTYPQQSDIIVVKRII
jgi:hypothetical protein